MPTTVRKKNHCTIEVNGAVVGAIFIAQQKRNVEAVHKRSYAPQAPIGDYLFMQEPARQVARALLRH